MEFAHELSDGVHFPSVLAAAPRMKLTPERVVDAAIALIDAEGLEQLTMRKLGAALNVEAMSLYKHVPNKQALLEGIRRRLASHVIVEGSVVGWKGLLGALARAAHRLLSEHPRAAPLFSSASFEELCGSRGEWERVERRMREMGFSDRLRQLTFRTVGAYVMGAFLSRQTDASHFEEGLELVIEGVELARKRRA
jgi:AcrR family transcriptional regulator